MKRESFPIDQLSPLAIALLAAGLALFAGAWWAYSKRRHIMDTPTSKVRSMAIGPVELVGTAVLPPGAQYQRGPFTDEPCLYWDYKVEEERTRHSKNGTQRYWHTLKDEHSTAPIALRDETGVVVIDQQGDSLPSPTVTRYGSGWGKDPPERVLQFLQSHGLSHETLFGINKKMRYTEERLMEGTPLFVHGNAVRREGARGEGNEALVVERKGDGMFLVSTKSEAQLLRRWTVGSLAFLVAGIACAGIGAYLAWGP